MKEYGERERERKKRIRRGKRGRVEDEEREKRKKTDQREDGGESREAQIGKNVKENRFKETTREEIQEREREEKVK